MSEDPRFASTTLRAKNQAVLRELLEQVFSKDDAAVWLDKCAMAGVPCAPINSYSQVLKDPQVAHMAWVQPLRLPTGAVTQTFASPIRLSGENLPVRFGPPKLGADTEAVLEAYATGVMR